MSNVSYTAIEKMGLLNKEKYHMDAPYPTDAAMFEFTEQRFWTKDGRGKKQITAHRSNLEIHAIHFIRQYCVGLRFKHDPIHMELKDNDGRSKDPGQIPYNMEMDIDRRCLEVAVHRFLESGVAEDAFDVYFIFLEMFIGSYSKTKEMIEMLSEFETNASSLLMKHRDHYAHSVYVFLMGLAYYDSSESYREEYRKKYEEQIKNERDARLDKEFMSVDEGSEVLAALKNKEVSEEERAAHFLKYWGLTSLFHDIGYPFELSFEQVKSYFGDTIKYVPFVTYNMNNFLVSEADDHIPDLEKDNDDLKIKLKNGELSQKEYDEKIEENKGKIKRLKKEKQSAINKLNKMLPEGYNENIEDNICIYLANALEYCLGERYTDMEMYTKFAEKKNASGKNKSCAYRDYMMDVLSKRNDPSKCGGYIDHAFFSAVMLTIRLLKVVDTDDVNVMYTNAVTAILLHNSFYKFSVTKYKDSCNDKHHFTVDINPLAYLLMLCDEIQCWDRTSYGKKSRGQVHPFNCRLTFNKDRIEAEYIFDSEYLVKDENGNYIKDENGNFVVSSKGGTYEKITSKEFLNDIEKIVSINGDDSFGRGAAKTCLSVSAGFEADTRYRKTYLSSSSFIHLYTFSFKIHQKNNNTEIGNKDEEMERAFNSLSLEYKMTHIERTKKFASYLHKINCFYSDKALDFEIVKRIDEKENSKTLEKIGALEHDRWCFNHYVMGWKNGKNYITDGKQDIPAREQLRIHKDMIDTSEGYLQDNAIKHYNGELEGADKLKEENKEKDKRSINNFLNIIANDDGLKVYRFNGAGYEEKDN